MSTKKKQFTITEAAKKLRISRQAVHEAIKKGGKWGQRTFFLTICKSGEIERQEKYRQWIDSQINEGEWEEIRQATQLGRLIGRETFQKLVEAMTGRRLVGDARGRPKKTARTTIEKVL